MKNFGSSTARIFILLLVALTVLLSACSGVSVSSEHQMLTVWSSYANQDIEILIKNYQTVRPNVEVIHTSEGLLNYFSFLKERMSQGLGPDLAIVPDQVLPSLIEAGIIEDLEKYSLDTSNFYSKALISLRTENKHLYGVPFGFQTMAPADSTELDRASPKQFSNSDRPVPLSNQPPD